MAVHLQGCTCYWEDNSDYPMYARLDVECPVHSSKGKTVTKWHIDEGGWMREGKVIINTTTEEDSVTSAVDTVGGVTSAVDTPGYDPSEQDVLSRVFTDMLRGVTKDGGTKRARGEKPGWYADPSHEAAIYSHLNKWKHGEVVDADSGAHPLIHLAWRALAIAYQETYGKRDPAHYWMDGTNYNDPTSRAQ